MANPPDTLDAQLNSLYQAYAQQIPDKVSQIEDAWVQVPVNGWDGESFKTLHRLTHSLNGTTGSFGFMAVSEAAQPLEALFKSLIRGTTAATEEQRQQINAMLLMLKRAAAEAKQSALTMPGLPTAPRAKAAEPARQPPIQVGGQPGADSRLIYLVEDEPEFAESLALQLGYFGYTVRTFSKLEEAKAAVNRTPPTTLIMDVIFPEGGLAGIETVVEIERGREPRIPVIFISQRTDLVARLQAVRAGGNAYFTKPINVSSLIDRLDSLTTRYAPEPYRVLIVEDSRTLAAYYMAILEQAGMLATVVSDPLQVMRPLVEFRPELILMDMYMPGCSGEELAKILRQQEAFVSIPIVFLSAEADPNRQQSAMNFGGDAFLTKPIQPDHLVGAVASRVERARTLRALMVRDSLTGLLNHTTTKEHLDTALELAKKQNSPLAFAMIDIDHFKSVNDTYGHPTGDRVIKSLARLLQQRLLKSDIVGRYGGEEFAVILPDTTGPAAAKVLEDAREAFAQLRQLSPEGYEFAATFSCGIAAYPRYQESASLGDAADRALYEAKREGRDRVVLDRD